MGSFLRLPPALLAALPLLFGPAAWAANCGCGTNCGTAADTAAACVCGPTDGRSCCETPPETPAQACEDCGCGCELTAPTAPAVPTADPVPVPTDLPLSPTSWATAESIVSLGLESQSPDPAARSPLRERLCVWRL